MNIFFKKKYIEKFLTKTGNIDSEASYIGCKSWPPGAGMGLQYGVKFLCENKEDEKSCEECDSGERCDP